MTNTETKAARGRPATFANRDAIVAALRAIHTGDAENIPSRHLLLKLVEMGRVEMKTAEPTGKRGRPAHVPALTGKARSWLATMERNAARRAAKAEA